MSKFQSAVMADATKIDLRKLDKISLNNEIVHLRSTANIAKINVIRKLTREIKKLKVEKSDLPEDDQLKRKTKAEKKIEQIQIIKTINKDDISTAALIYRPKESLELLQNPIASQKDKLVVKIARNKVLVAGVAKMLTKYKPIKHRKLEAIVASIGAKKRKKLVLPTQLAADKSDQSAATSEKKTKKLKHTPTQDSGVSSEESDGDEESDTSAQVSTKNNKKGKRPATSESVATSDESDAEEEVETLTKRRKKQNHADIVDFHASSSDEMHVKLLPVAEGKISLKKKDKTKSKKLKAFPIDMDEEQINSNQVDTAPKKKSKAKNSKAFKNNAEVEDLIADEVNGLPKKKSKSKKLKAFSSNINDEDDLDTEQAPHLLKKKSKISRKKEQSSDADVAEPKKPVVRSTKAIRFSDFLKMEAESLQSKVAAEPQAAKCEKEVNEFFVSGDGRSEVLTRVKTSEPAVVKSKTNPKYEQIREQYLKEFGAVPNRTELRRIEREGIRDSKSFHKLIVKEPADQPGSSKGERGPKLPDRLFVRKPTVDDLPVHPSWEAKKKAKEMLHIPFEGKKIIFD